MGINIDHKNPEALTGDQKIVAEAVKRFKKCVDAESDNLSLIHI